MENFVRFQEQPCQLEFLQYEKDVGGESVLFVHQFLRNVVGGFASFLEFSEHVVIKCRGKIVRTLEFQSEQVRTEELDALLRLLEGNGRPEV